MGTVSAFVGNPAVTKETKTASFCGKKEERMSTNLLYLRDCVHAFSALAANVALMASVMIEEGGPGQKGRKEE
jgi:hypothetical protein